MRSKSYFLYTKAFSDIGNMMEMMVMNAVIYSMTNSTSWLSAVLAFRVFGGILSSLFSGILADRMNRRYLMIFSDIARGISVIILCFYPTPTLFLTMAFILGFFGSFFTVSFSAEIPQIFGEDKILEINAFISRLAAISMVIGFLSAAFLSNIVNYRVIIAIDGLSFFLSALVLVIFKWNNTVKKSGSTSWKVWLSDIKEVNSYLVLRPVLLIIFIVFLFQTFAASSHNVGIPLLSEELNSKRMTFYQGLIWGSWGIGSIISTWIIPKFVWLKNHVLLFYLSSSILMSLGFILLLSNKVLWLVLFFAFFTGMFDATAGTYFSTMIQQTENDIRGRIFGISNLFNRLGFTLGFIATSYLLKILTMPHLVWLFHGGMIVIILLSIFYLGSKKMFKMEKSFLVKKNNELTVIK